MHRAVYAGLLGAALSWGAGIDIVPEVQCFLYRAPCPPGIVQFQNDSRYGGSGNFFSMDPRFVPYGAFSGFRPEDFNGQDLLDGEFGFHLTYSLTITAHLRTGGKPRMGRALLTRQKEQNGSTDGEPFGFVAGPWGCGPEIYNACNGFGVTTRGWFDFPLGQPFVASTHINGMYVVRGEGLERPYAVAGNSVAFAIELFEADGTTPVQIYVVPEPAPAALVIPGAAALLLLRLRRKEKSR